MGGGSSKAKQINSAPVHYPRTNWSGKVIKGGFSAGPRTMVSGCPVGTLVEITPGITSDIPFFVMAAQEKIRTRSDFCLLKIVEEDIVKKVSMELGRREEGKGGGARGRWEMVV